MLLPHTVSSFIFRGLYALYTKQDPEFFLYVHETIRTPVGGEDVRASHLKPDKTPVGVCRFLKHFFVRSLNVVSVTSCCLCVCVVHICCRLAAGIGSDQCVKCKNILCLTFKAFFFLFFFSLSFFLSFSETGVWKSSCRGQNKICDFSVTRLISSSVTLFMRKCFLNRFQVASWVSFNVDFNLLWIKLLNSQV